MTLFQIIQILKEIALAQPNIKSATDGSIYDVMNTNPSVKYDVVHFSQTTHQSDEETDFYGLNIFYVSRLEDSLEDNRLQIQSIGKEVLDNIIRTFCENWNIDFPVITYTPFTQKFNDLCAGCYCNLRLEIPKEIICADDFVAEVVPGSGIKLQDIGITITQNGLVVVTPDAEYDGIGEIRIQTEVPQSTAELQYKEVEYTENGEYVVRPDQDYDGLTEVAVSVDVPDRYDEGYDDGKTDGENEQKAKLVSTVVTQNGTYSREDGYSSIEVNVPQTGQTINNQTKSYPISNIQTQLIYYEKPGDEKWMYTFENSPLTLTYDSGYTGLEKLNLDLQIDAYQAIELGENQQKAKMVSAAITENGTYSREDGYSSIEVNVPQTGQTINNQDKTFYLSTADLNPQIIPIGGGHYLITGSTTVTYDPGYTGLGVATIIPELSADEAIALGEQNQKAKMVATAITENGEYGRPDGYSAITVNVDDRYDEGYDDGYKAGAAACSGLLATAITLNVASAITDSGTATTTYSPSTAYTDIYYTSSNPTKAIIDENTGAITVFENGTTTICTRDRMSGLQDCKTVAVVKSVETSITINVASVITGSSTATTTVTPSTATTNLVYSSSDTTKATINSGTGVINVVANGQVTFCVRDTISNKQSCKTVYVVTAGTMVSQLDFRYETTGANQTNILFYGTANDNSANFNRFYNALITILIDGEDVGKSSSNIVTPTVERNYKRYKYTFPIAGVHTVRYYVTRSLSGDGLAGLELTNLLFADNLGEEHLKAAYIGSGYEVLGSGVFQGATEMTAVTIPNTVTRIGPFTFEKSGIITLNIPNSVTGLTTIQGDYPTEGEGICNHCTSLTSVTIGSGLTKIPAYTFQDCTALRDIRINRTTPPTLESLAFTGCSSLTNIYVPASSVNTYKSASGWSQYASKIKAKP